MTFPIIAAAAFMAAASPCDRDAADRAAITAIIKSVTMLADRGDFEALERLFAPTVYVDYSSLSGAPAQKTAARDLLAGWAAVLPGFDRTRHVQTDLTIDIPVAGRANIASAVQADHWLGDGVWTVRGRYLFELQRDDAQWRVTAMTFQLQDEVGSRTLLSLAAECVSNRASD